MKWCWCCGERSVRLLHCREVEGSIPATVIIEKKIAQAGGKTGILWLSFILSLKSSALDHSSTAPPYSHHFCLLPSAKELPNAGIQPLTSCSTGHHSTD